MKLRAIFLFISLLSFSAHSVFSQEKLTRSIDSLIEIKTPRVFNGVIIISRDGKDIYKRSHGFNNIDKKTTLRLNDQFLIGSISKQFTATLVLREVQAGHISLNRNIRFYLPRFHQRWADSVTVQQLLNHTSGITGLDKNLAFSPGTKFSYSNLNYSILGQIIEKTSGKSYAELTANLFKLCDMSSSTVPPAPNSKPTQLVKGYAEDENQQLKEQKDILELLTLPVMGAPASGMVSTAEDLIRWLNDLHHGKLLADSTYQMMISNSVIRPHRWGEVKYGDGIQTDQIDHIKELSMSGYIPGFISTMIYYPATRVSIVVLENISPDPADMNRVYYFHDQIRKLVRADLVKE